MWWVKSEKLPPTLTSFAPGSPSATTGFGGELGVPGTIVLSPSHFDYGALPGGRFTFGRWMDPARSWGLEAQGLFLSGGNATFSSSSGGTPSLRVPFNNPPPGAGFPVGPSSFVLADPGFAEGNQTINSSLHFWGVEGNGILRGANFVNTGPVALSFLAGIRYLDISEDLSIASSETLLGGGGSFTGNDDFATHNRFIGPQLGVRAEMTEDTPIGPFETSILAKLAIGDNRETVAINGSSTAVGFGFATPVTAPGGLLTQATNMGTRTRDTFTAVPELQLDVGYRLPYGFKLFLAYNFIYLSDAVRPGDQVDTTLNLTGNPVISGPGATLLGAARPMPLFASSTFWAQGLDIGIRYQF